MVLESVIKKLPQNLSGTAKDTKYVVTPVMLLNSTYFTLIFHFFIPGKCLKTCVCRGYKNVILA